MTLAEQILAAIEPVDAQLFQLVATGPNVPSETDVAAFEQKAGFALPAEFRALLLSALGGLYVRATEEAWPSVEPLEVAPTWRFLRGVALLGMATDIPEERLDIRFQLEEARERGLDDFLPVMTIDGSRTVYGFDRDGRLLVNDLDTDTVEPTEEQDLGTLYTREIADLIARQRRVAAGE